MKSKYGIGVMSKNIVDATIDYVNENNCSATFIPSRRQVDFLGGYVNGWTTKTLASYVKSKTDKILLKRDHGGPSQGQEKDDGYLSLEEDCLYFDAIHIDPWKIARNLRDGSYLTKEYIRHCYRRNENIIYEVGTEESIFKYEASELDELLSYLKEYLSPKLFDKIKYAVIQSGTSLKETKNTGSYNKQRLIDMIAVCKKYNLLSKEHNGDYLPKELIGEKFKTGLDSINIAPEFGQIETRCYLKEVKNTPLFDQFFDICYDSEKWEKWVENTFDPFEHQEELINICGHYVLNYPDFISQIKNNVRLDIDDVIKYSVKAKLVELYGI